MQDRYVGDIGDFVKYALLRVVTGESKLGVAWYLHPNESASADGRHTDYLALPAEWRCLDEDLFDGLKKIVESTRRSVTAVEASKVLPDVVFADERLDIAKVPVSCRSSWRRIWFEGVQRRLDGCDVVFADPDNGLLPDSRFQPTVKRSAKSIPEQEVRDLSAGRPMVVYHHNTRRKGGHRAEIADWQSRLPGRVYAYYWRRWSNRTFFLVNGDSRTVARLGTFAKRWDPNGELIRPP